jgi:hypothetical protein
VLGVVEDFGLGLSPDGVDGVTPDGRSTLGAPPVPGLVSVWAKAPGISKKPARVSTVAAMISFLMVYLPS